MDKKPRPHPVRKWRDPRTVLTGHLTGVLSRLIHTFTLTSGPICPISVCISVPSHYTSHQHSPGLLCGYTTTLLTSKALPLAISLPLERAGSGWAALLTMIKHDFIVHLSGNCAPDTTSHDSQLKHLSAALNPGSGQAGVGRDLFLGVGDEHSHWGFLSCLSG